MARAIDAEVLEATIVGSFTMAGAMAEQYKSIFDVMANEIKKIIDEQPTIDPVKHGKWIERTLHEYDPHTDEHWDETYYKCSECGCDCWASTNFCQECGARMDGE